MDMNGHFHYKLTINKSTLKSPEATYSLVNSRVPRAVGIDFIFKLMQMEPSKRMSIAEACTLAQKTIPRGMGSHHHFLIGKYYGKSSVNGP